MHSNPPHNDCPITDERLVAETINGCPKSFAEIARRYSGRLYHFLKFKTGNEQDAEDLTQETLLRAFHYLGQFRAENSFSTWLFTIAHRLAINYFRKQSRKKAYSQGSDPVDERTPDFHLSNSESARNIWNIARQLKNAEFEVLWLRYAEDMTMADIARVLNKTQIHIRVLLFRARQRLKNLLEKQTLSDPANLTINVDLDAQPARVPVLDYSQ